MPREHKGVIGTANEDLTKHTSYGPEQQVPRSPGRPIVRQWTSPSYDNHTGRAARVADDRYAGSTRHDKPEDWKQVPDAGHHSTTNPLKGRTRPGRW